MKKSSRKHDIHRFFFIYIMIFIFGVLVAIAATTIFLPKPVTLHTLSLLPVPAKTPLVYLPGPYEAAIIESPVLGAETIDPSDIVLYINNERMKRGAPPLRENKTLAEAAAMRANVILKHENFSHQDPYDHIQLDTVLPLLNYPFIYASENIGMGDNSAAAFVNGFMSSTSHRANLLNPDLQETGVAVATGPYRQYWVNVAVQIFAIPTTSEQYLGYSKADIEKYKKLLDDVAHQIAYTRDRIDNHVGDEEYYAGWQKILIRQQEILTQVYNAMLARQPFMKNFIALITEYNTNWNLVPKQSRI